MADFLGAVAGDAAEAAQRHSRGHASLGQDVSCDFGRTLAGFFEAGFVLVLKYDSRVVSCQEEGQMNSKVRRTLRKALDPGEKGSRRRLGPVQGVRTASFHR